MAMAGIEALRAAIDGYRGDVPELIAALREVRRLGTTGPDVQVQCWNALGVAVATRAQRLAVHEDAPDAVLVAVQALANMTTNNEVTQAALWAALVVDEPVLVEIVVGSGHAVAAVVAYIVHACTRTSDARRESLRDGRGAHLFYALLRAADRFSADESADAIELVHEVCLTLASHPADLRAVIAALQQTLDLNEILTLLSLLDASPERVPGAAMGALVPLLQWLVDLNADGAAGAPLLSKAREAATQLIHMMADCTALEDRAAAVALCQAGAVPTLVRLLGHLHKAEPPVPPSRQPDASQPNFGLKKELVRALANMSHGSFEVQEQLRLAEGVPLLLDLCKHDSQNPMMREWAIFAIRNCTENNAANQEIIRGLEARGVADQQSLRELGLDGEVGEDGRLRVRQRPQ